MAVKRASLTSAPGRPLSITGQCAFPSPPPSDSLWVPVDLSAIHQLMNCTCRVDGLDYDLISAERLTSNSPPSSDIHLYGAIVHSHSSGVEFTQWRPLEKVTSATLNLVRPGSLSPTSISAFFHFPGGAADAIGDLFELSTMLWPVVPCSL